MLTPRRRALVAVLVTLPLAWAYVEIGWHLLFDLLQVLRNGNGFGSCGSGLSRVVRTFNGCNTFSYHWGYALVELLLMTAVVVAVAYGLARWVAYPVREIADAVTRFGPSSLGLRLRRGGPRDETRALADAIDGMLGRLAEGYEAQRRFASTASHELRTPLATQRALIEVSMSSALTPDQLELLSRQLLSTNERNERLVDGLLTLAETDRGLLTSMPIRLDAVAREVVQGWQQAAKEAEVELTAELGEAVVVGEQPLLERLVGNLVHNAIKYNEPGGWVRVVTAPGLLVVANSGPQVPPPLVAGLFEPFRRVAGERLDHGSGVGLGLTIVRSIAAAHGGWVQARANPAGGLTVEVRLRPA